MAKSSQRFPRWNLTQSEKLVIAILRLTYNRMARARDDRKRYWNWDIYRMKNIRGKAMRAFMLLAPVLIEKHIDPSLYVKVLCRYGMYRHKRTMPHPTFLASPKALEIFNWLVKRNRELYGLRGDWKKNLDRGWTPEDIYASVKSAMRIFKEAKKQLGVPSSQVFLAVFKDLSPAFTAAYVKLSPEWKSFIRHLRLYGRDPELWASAKRAIKSELER